MGIFYNNFYIFYNNFCIFYSNFYIFYTKIYIFYTKFLHQNWLFYTKIGIFYTKFLHQNWHFYTNFCAKIYIFTPIFANFYTKNFAFFYINFIAPNFAFFTNHFAFLTKISTLYYIKTFLHHFFTCNKSQNLPTIRTKKLMPKIEICGLNFKVSEQKHFKI